MADDLGQGATAAQQQSMEIPLVPGVGAIPGFGAGQITPQPHVVMPPVPKPMTVDPNPGWQNTSGKPLSRGGEKKANRYNAIAAAGNMVGKYVNKKNEDKYNAIQYDLQRVLEAAQIANDPSMPPEVRKHNEAIVEATMNGKHGKDIQKIFGDMNPFGEPKDPKGQQALTKANQMVQQKTAVKQAIAQKLQSAAPNTGPGIGGNMGMPPAPTATPGAIPGGGSSINPAMMSGAPVSGAAASTIAGPQVIKPPAVTPNPSAGSSAAPAAAQSSASSTPMSDKLMSMFPTVPGLSRTAQMQAQLMKEFQPMIIEQIKMNTELARVQGNLAVVDAKTKGLFYNNYMKYIMEQNLQQLRQQGKISEDEFKHALRMKEINAKHTAAMSEIRPQIKASMLNQVLGKVNTDIADVQKQINTLSDPLKGDPVKNADKLKALGNQRTLLEQQRDGVLKDLGDIVGRTTGYDLSKVGETTDDITRRYAGGLNDNPEAAAIYGGLAGSARTSSEAAAEAEDSEADSDSDDQ